MTTQPTTWCFCGRLLENNRCPKHKENITKEPRKKIGKWSGYSKSINKFNDYK